LNREDTLQKITREEFLDIFPFFQKAPQTLVDEILARSKYVENPSNTLLQLEGQYCATLGFMIFGDKRIYKVSEKGREITLYEVVRGEICILNATCILSNTPCPVNAVSLTDIGMLLLSALDFRDLVARYEEMRTYVFSLISQHIASIMELLMEVIFKRMDERLMDYLVEKSEEGKLVATRQRIANDLGTAREVVSRLLKDFERKGLVNLDKNSIELIHY